MTKDKIEQIHKILREITGCKERQRKTKKGEDYYSIKCPKCGDKDKEGDNLNFYPNRPKPFKCYRKENGENCGHGDIIHSEIKKLMDENE